MTKQKLKAPSGLDVIARRKWDEIVGDLPDCEQGTLDALQQYVVAWSSWIWAGDDDARLKWSRCVRQWGQELGLSPRSRRKSAGARDVGKQDPLLKLIGRKKAE